MKQRTRKRLLDAKASALPFDLIATSLKMDLARPPWPYPGRHPGQWYIMNSKRYIAVPFWRMADWERRKGFRKAKGLASTWIGQNYRVSTVFLALDHSVGMGDPVLFETMVFAKGKQKGNDIAQVRYRTWQDAMRGHRDMVRKVRKGQFTQLENDDVTMDMVGLGTLFRAMGFLPKPGQNIIPFPTRKDDDAEQPPKETPA